MSERLKSSQWPDPLSTPEATDIERMLIQFWETLSQLPELLNRGEQLLASETVKNLRATVIDLMLALNGIRRPSNTRHLNSYLSLNQRAALERTLLAPEVTTETWIGEAVALVVIYRWYAPQLVDRHGLAYPSELEAKTWYTLRRSLPDWPAEVTTD